MQQLKVPTTVVVGDRDYRCTKISSFIADVIPGAELAVIQDSGHMSSLEQPEQFNNVLERLLARVEMSHAAGFRGSS
jgi:pimeloyl-ACP methyl ester carboxylesterase